MVRRSATSASHGSSDRRRGTTTVAATPTFAAPEVLRGERATPASDVYSAACLTYELLAGRAPYDGANGWEVAQKHLESPAPHVRKVRLGRAAPISTRRSTAGMEKREREAVPVRRELRRRDRDVGARRRRRRASAPADDLTVPVTPRAGRTSRRDRGDLRPPCRIRHAPRSSARSPASRRGGSHAAPRARVQTRRQRGRALEPAARGTRSRSCSCCSSARCCCATGDRRRSPSPTSPGKKLVDARTALRDAGLKVDVSYRPVTEGEAGRVLETIPASDRAGRAGIGRPRDRQRVRHDTGTRRDAGAEERRRRRRRVRADAGSASATRTSEATALRRAPPARRCELLHRPDIRRSPARGFHGEAGSRRRITMTVPQGTLGGCPSRRRAPHHPPRMRHRCGARQSVPRVAVGRLALAALSQPGSHHPFVDGRRGRARRPRQA